MKTIIFWSCVAGAAQLGFLVGWSLKARMTKENSDLALIEKTFAETGYQMQIGKVKSVWKGLKWLIYGCKDKVGISEYQAMLNLAKKLDDNLSVIEN